jgi:hypothetical protein
VDRVTKNKEKDMNITRRIKLRAFMLTMLITLSSVASIRLQAQDLPDTTGTCGGATYTIPFVDVSPASIFFCSIAAAFFSGLTTGTTDSTYSPMANVTRDQMAAFVTRAHDQGLRRTSRPASLNQWETPNTVPLSARTTVGSAPFFVAADSQDLWVTNNGDGSVSRVRASDGRLIETYAGTASAFGVLVARGRIFVTANSSPGALYEIDPRLAPAAPGAVITRATLPNIARGITTDGFFIWTANGNSVSKTDPDTGVVSTFTTGLTSPVGIVFDGANIWVTDIGNDTIKKLSSAGAVLDTVPVGVDPQYPVFDGINIWVPNIAGQSVTVVRALGTTATGANRVIATLTGNGLNEPAVAAFDGQFVLVTNTGAGAQSLSLWKAAELVPQGSAPTGMVDVLGACSSGVNFWIALRGQNALARF